MNKVYLITAIDTDAGKTMVTGMLAKYLAEKGIRVITQKMVQTGNTGFSEDVLTHRKIMGTGIFSEDREGLTCPYIFPFPASPHFSAGLVNKEINPEKITLSTEKLLKKYDCVLLEGVGGLMVPLTRDFLVIDYLVQHPYPVILVTSGKLGSINHTLLSLEACRHRNLPLVALIYNHCMETHPLITADTLSLLKNKLGEYYPEAEMLEFPLWNPTENFPMPDFGKIF